MKAILNNFFSIKSLRSFITASVILIVSFSSFLQDAHASHGMGMDLTYQQVGQDSFLVTLAFYRDCHGVYPDPTASLRMRSANCGRNLSTTMPLLGSGTETTPVCASLVTECNGGSFPGSEEYIYQKLIVLPAKCTDWTLSASICCRNAGITTINQPNTKSIFVETKLNNFISNSSPRFSNNPVPFVCANQTYCFNNGATDADGDSLVYTLVTPRTGVNLSDTITFKAGFDKTDPITSSPKVSLDPFTGDLCMFPTDSTQIGVLSIIVEEYRNGVLIGSIMRDIQLRILGCPNGNNLPSVSGIDSTSAKSIKVCANSNVSFNLYADDSDTAQTITMTWNNGIPGASFNVTAGKRPVGTFSWTPNNGNIRNQPYSFTVEVRDDNCPFSGLQVFSYFVYVVGVQAIVDSVFDPTCPNACDGRLTAQVLNGIPPFTYSWNDPSTQFGPRATGLCAGAYTVTGTDSTGCQTQAIVSIFDPKPMILTMDSVSVSCPGYTDGQAIVSGITEGVSPYTYTWEVSAGLQSTDTAFNLPKGTYSVTVTDSNGCTMTDSIQVPEPLPIDINMIAVTQVSCKGLNDGEATASVTGGTGPYTYQWDALSVFQTTDTAKNLIAGLHTLTITDSKGCTSVDTITITEPGSAIALALTKTDVDCKGDSTGTATIVASGGTPPYAYTWDPGTGSQTTATAINLPAGIYSVTVTDLNNCSAYPNIEIIEPNIALTITSVDSFVQCFGDVNGVLGVEVIGGTTPYTFLWDAAAASQTTQYASALGAGIYKVVVTDSIGCQDSSDVSLLQASAPLTVIIDRVNVTCNNGSDGSAYVSVSGGEPSYTIQWDTNTGSQTTDTAFNLKAGIYFVSIVDSFGCQVDTNITVTEPPPLLTLTTNSTNVTCFGDSNGTASVVVSGGTPPYSYLWSANSGSQTTDTAVGLKAGIYFVTVFDSNYCVTSPGILIEEPVMALSASISSHITSCFNGNDGYAYAQGIGGTGNNYTYQWNAAANSQVNDTAFNLAAGTYGVTVTDSFNCTFDTSVLVTQPSTPLVVNLSSTPILCFGGNTGFGYASAAGGGAPYTYLWKTGTQSNDTAIGLTRGYHSISVEDTLGCIITDSVYVGGPPEPTTGFADGYPVLCNEGNTGFAVAIGTGGTPPYTYVWGNNANNQVNDTAFNLRADTFMVTVIDSNGCDSVLSVIVTEPPALDDSIYISSNFNGSSIQCFGDTNGSATVVAFGGTTPYTYLWGASTGNQTTDTAFNLGEGIYTVDITDSNGCVKSANISLSSPEQNGITIDSLRHVSCFARNDGMILVAGVGGTAPYQYSWNTTPIQTGSLASNLAIGSYKVTITDTNGCPYDTTININQPTPLVLNKIEIDALCHNQNTGSAIAQVSGGTPPYSYLD